MCGGNQDNNDLKDYFSAGEQKDSVKLDLRKFIPYDLVKEYADKKQKCDKYNSNVCINVTNEISIICAVIFGTYVGIFIHDFDSKIAAYILTAIMSLFALSIYIIIMCMCYDRKEQNKNKYKLPEWNETRDQIDQISIVKKTAKITRQMYKNHFYEVQQSLNNRNFKSVIVIYEGKFQQAFLHPNEKLFGVIVKEPMDESPANNN